MWQHLSCRTARFANGLPRTHRSSLQLGDLLDAPVASVPSPCPRPIRVSGRKGLGRGQTEGTGGERGLSHCPPQVPMHSFPPSCPSKSRLIVFPGGAGRTPWHLLGQGSPQKKSPPARAPRFFVSARMNCGNFGSPHRSSEIEAATVARPARRGWSA